MNWIVVPSNDIVGLVMGLIILFPVKFQTHLGPIPGTQELRDKNGKRALDLAGRVPAMLVMLAVC